MDEKVYLKTAVKLEFLCNTSYLHINNQKNIYCQENHSIAFTWSLILSSKFSGVVFAGIHKDVQDINKWQTSVYKCMKDGISALAI